MLHTNVITKAASDEKCVTFRLCLSVAFLAEVIQLLFLFFSDKLTIIPVLKSFVVFFSPLPEVAFAVWSGQEPSLLCLCGGCDRNLPVQQQPPRDATCKDWDLLKKFQSNFLPERERERKREHLI